MTKLLKTLIAILITAMLLPATALAADQLWDDYTIPATRQKERLVDNADLLSSYEESSLLSTLDSLSEQHSCNIVILTVDEHTGPIQDFADDYFDYNGFGCDYDGAGILFMLSMSDREWAISTSGDGIAAFTDYGQEKMMDALYEPLGDGDYYAAFNKYAEICDRYLAMYESGTAFDVGMSMPKTASETAGEMFMSFILSLIVAFIVIMIMKSKLKSVKMNVGASGYQTKSGLKLSINRDSFVNKTLTKTPIPKSSDSGRSGGGSSVHHSSSGSSHGGSHGHF